MMASSIIISSLLPLVPFSVREYIRLQTRCLNNQRFQSMRVAGECSSVYDNRFGVERLSGVGSWIKRWMHRSGCGAVLQCEKETYLDMPFIRCTE